MSISKDNITAVILAGGRGQRFEGKDKGLIEYKNRPIVEHVINAIKPQVASIIINANRNVKTYARYGYPVIGDEIPDFQGPLAGFATGMKHAKTSHVLPLPCDGPFISNDYVSRMILGISEQETQLAVAKDAVRMQPVHALISVDLLASLNRYLEQGNRKIDRWYAQQNIALVDFSDSPATFKNVNTREQLQSLERADH